MDIVPWSRGGIREHTDYYSVPYSGASYDVARYVDTARKAYSIVKRGYGIYQKALQDKKRSGTPFLRGSKKVKTEPGLQKEEATSFLIDGSVRMVGGRGPWRRSFKNKPLSKNKRFRYKKHFISVRNKRQYLTKWGVVSAALATPYQPGCPYYYGEFVLNPQSDLSAMKLDSDTKAGVVEILHRQQKAFISNQKTEMYFKNINSHSINYRIVQFRQDGQNMYEYDDPTVGGSDLTEVLVPIPSLAAIEPWSPIFPRDEFTKTNLKFMKQEVGTLRADEEVTVKFTCVPGFCNFTNQVNSKKRFIYYIWYWSELLIAKQSTGVKFGYVQFFMPIFMRQGFDVYVDQGVTLNNDVSHGYDTAAGFTEVTNFPARSEEKMVDVTVAADA